MRRKDVILLLESAPEAAVVRMLSAAARGELRTTPDAGVN
jgi:hypothetical protein